MSTTLAELRLAITDDTAPAQAGLQAVQTGMARTSVAAQTLGGSVTEMGALFQTATRTAAEPLTALEAALAQTQAQVAAATAVLPEFAGGWEASNAALAAYDAEIAAASAATDAAAVALTTAAGAVTAETEALVANRGAVQGDTVVWGELATAQKAAAAAAAETGAAEEALAVKTTAAKEATKGHGVELGLHKIALLAVGAAAVDVGVKATEFSAHWQDAMQQIQNNTGMTDADMRGLDSTIQQVMTNSTASFDKTADAAFHTANYGFKSASDQALILDASMKSATTTGGDISKTAEVIAGSLHFYGKSAEDAAKFTDTLHQAAQNSNSSLEDFAASSQLAIGMAAQFKVPLDDVASGLATLQRNGMNASQSQTAIMNVMKEIVQPTHAAKDAILAVSKASGVDLVRDFTAAGLETKHISGVLADLSLAYQKAGYSTAQAEQQTLAIFSAMKGGRAALDLLGTGAKDYKQNLDQLAQTMAGTLTPTQQAYERSQQTLAYQSGELGNTVQLLGKDFGDGLLPKLTETTTRINEDKAAMDGWKTAAHGAGEAVGGFLSNLGQGLEVLGNAGSYVEKLNAIMVVTANNAAGSLGLMSQAEVDAANKSAVAGATQETAADKTAAAYAKLQSDATGSLHAMRDNIDGDLDHISHQCDLKTNEMAAAATLHTKNMATDVTGTVAAMADDTDAEMKSMSGMTVEDIRSMRGGVSKEMDELKAKMAAGWNEMTSDASAGGTNVGTGFGENFYNAVAEWINKTNAAAQKAAANVQAMLTASSNEYIQQYQHTNSDIYRLQNKHIVELGKAAEQERVLNEKKAESAEKAGARHAAALEKHNAALARHADAAATAEQRYTDTVFKAMTAAVKDTETGGAGVLAATQTLMDSLDEVTKAKIPGLSQQWTAWVKAAASGNPPEAARMKQGLLDELEKLANGSNQHWAVYARAAIDSMKHVEDAAATTASKLDSATLKMEQSFVGGVSKLATEVQSPTQSAADTMVSILDLLNVQGLDKVKGLTDGAQRLLTDLQSAAPPTVQATHDRLIDILQKLAADGDAATRLFAQKALANLQDLDTQATTKLAGLKAALASSLSGDLLDLGKGGDPSGMLLKLQQAAQQADAAGLKPLGDSIRQTVAGVQSGAISLQAAGSTLFQALTDMANSTDQTISLTARKGLADWTAFTTQTAAATDKMKADVTDKIGQMAATIGQELASGKGIKDFPAQYKAMMDLAAQAQAAGLTTLAAQLRDGATRLATEGKAAGQGIYDGLISALQAAAAQGDVTAGLLIQDLQRVQAQAQATAAENASYAASVTDLKNQIDAATDSLQQYKDAVSAAQVVLDGLKTAEAGAKTALDAASASVTAAKAQVQGLQQGYQDAQRALTDFKNAKLEGEGASSEAQFQNQQKQKQLQLDILNLQMGGASASNPQLKALQAQLEQTRLAGEQMRLQAEVTFDPLHHALEQIGKDQHELTFDQAKAGAQGAQADMAKLNTELATSQRHLANVEAAQASAQKAYNAASQAVKDQEAEIARLNATLKAHEDQVKATVDQIHQQEADLKTQHDATLQAISDGQAVAQALSTQTTAWQQAASTIPQATAAIGQAAAGIATTVLPPVQALPAQVGTALAQIAPAAGAALGTLPATVQTALAPMFAVWNRVFGPEPAEGNLLQRLWGHEEGTFWHGVVAYTRQRVQEWFDVVWVAEFDTMANKMTAYLHGKAAEISVGGADIGAQMMAGLAAGITDNTGLAEQAIADAVRATVGAGQAAAKTGSPSQLVIDLLGGPMGQGIPTGILAQIPAAGQAMTQLVQQTVQAIPGLTGAVRNQLRGILDLAMKPGATWDTTVAQLGALHLGDSLTARMDNILRGLFSGGTGSGALAQFIATFGAGGAGLLGPPVPAGGAPGPTRGPLGAVGLPPPATGGGGAGPITVQVVVQGITGDITNPASWDAAAEAISQAIARRVGVPGGGYSTGVRGP